MVVGTQSIAANRTHKVSADAMMETPSAKMRNLHPDTMAVVSDWNAEDVVAWLESLNPVFASYSTNFISEGIDGVWL